MSKSNGGLFVIHDFGRQRVEPAAPLNRWIVPLECRKNYHLTLATGKKIQVPFDQLIIFSTNLERTTRPLMRRFSGGFLTRIEIVICRLKSSENSFSRLASRWAALISRKRSIIS